MAPSWTCLNRTGGRSVMKLLHCSALIHRKVSPMKLKICGIRAIGSSLNSSLAAGKLPSIAIEYESVTSYTALPYIM